MPRGLESHADKLFLQEISGHYLFNLFIYLFPLRTITEDYAWIILLYGDIPNTGNGVCLCAFT